MFSWILTVIITAVLLVFCLFNGQAVAVNLWPWGSWEAPLCLLALTCGLLGALAGAVVVWVRSLSTAAELRHANRQLEHSQKELAALKAKLETALLSTGSAENPAAHRDGG